MNAANEPTLGERLLRVEPEDAELRRRYEEGVLALRERRLTTAQKVAGWVSAPLNLGLALLAAWRLGEAGEGPEWVAFHVAGAAGLLAVGGWTLYVLLGGGRVGWRADRAFQVVGAVALVALAAAAFEVGRSLDDRRAANGMFGIAVVMLAGAAAGLAVEWARRIRLEARVAALENQLRVAELSREVAGLREGRGRPGNGASPTPS